MFSGAASVFVVVLMVLGLIAIGLLRLALPLVPLVVGLAGSVLVIDNEIGDVIGVVVVVVSVAWVVPGSVWVMTITGASMVLGGC